MMRPRKPSLGLITEVGWDDAEMNPQRISFPVPQSHGLGHLFAATRFIPSAKALHGLFTLQTLHSFFEGQAQGLPTFGSFGSSAHTPMVSAAAIKHGFSFARLPCTAGMGTTSGGNGLGTGNLPGQRVLGFGFL
jgi:hypothetical protein